MFKLNINMLNKLSPHVKLPYSQIRGTFAQRQNKAIKLTDKLYQELLPKFKNGSSTIGEVQESINKVLGKDINISVRKNTVLDFDGGSDILYSEFTGAISKTTLDINTNRNNKVMAEDLVTIMHEFLHLTDQLFHPKYLSRNQTMANLGLYTDKYNQFYDKMLYAREFPTGKRDRAYIKRHLRHKIHKFLRKMPVEDKIDYLQDARYCLQSEYYAFQMQAKIAKRLNKKHFPINKKDLVKENGNFMFQEKINLLKQMALEIIKKEREKFAKMPKYTYFD